MLKITETEEIWWPVTVYQPREDGSGRAEKFSVKIKYRLLTRSEAGALVPEDSDLTDQERWAAISDRVCDHVLDWEGIDLPCEPHNVRMAMDKPYFSDAIIKGLQQASAGGRAKN